LIRWIDSGEFVIVDHYILKFIKITEEWNPACDERDLPPAEHKSNPVARIAAGPVSLAR
jgi:hypothetical protein